MRISAAAIALFLTATFDSNDTAAARHEHSRFLARPLPWGVVPNGGGDASTPSSTPDENAEEKGNDVDEKENATSTTKTAISSQILNSVSAGGASHADAAFVGALRAKGLPAGTTGTSAQENNGSSSSTSSLSIATDQQKNVDATETTIHNNDVKSILNNPLRKKGPLKILFLSSDTGGGHRASAEALANQFQRLYPGTTYDLFDIWTDTDTSWPYYKIRDFYTTCSATPWKWRTLYHVSNSAVWARFTDMHSYYMTEDMIREKMESYDPDVVVSVHPTMNYVPYWAARKISEKRDRDIPFFTVVTDFGSGHCTWFNKDVDKIYLASDPIKEIAQRRGGVPDDKIVMSGLPIRYDFAAQADAMCDRTTEAGKAHQLKIREQLNIDTKKRMILVMGGGEGVGSLSDIVNEIYAKCRTQGVDATIAVVCGRNEKLKVELETRCWDTVVSQSLQSYESLKSRFFTTILTPHAHRSRRIQLALDRAAAKAAKGNDVADVPGNVDVIPLGFVKNMAEYMVAADVLVSKAGPGTIAEAAAVGLPVMVTSHLPGQEAGNVDIVLNGGFGDFCEDPETIGLEVACWLQDDQLLGVMSKKALEVGLPHAAEEIALDIGDMTHQWMERNSLKQDGQQNGEQ